MEIRGYDIKLNKQLWSYEFCSEGPKGKIKKIVQFFRFTMDGREYFNLFLGDWDEEVNSANDFIVSNNQDSQKVLVTVAQIVLEFTKCFPNAIIYAKGNTPSRTRLYQMGISKHWFEISELFTVLGQINNKWQLFLKNVNYDAFMVYRKNNVYL